MQVKGIAYLARKSLLLREIGADRLARFMRVLVEVEPWFAQEITATTTIPIAAFLRFNDELVKNIFHGDVTALWRFGEKSAEWSFTEGPHKALFESRDVPTFARSASELFGNYFDAGGAESTVNGDVVEVHIRVPHEHRHVYFEYALVGYFKRGLELVGARVEPHRVRGFADGSADALYHLRLIL